MTAEELAQRLTGSGKEITPARVQKFARHVTSLVHLEATLALLSQDDADLVRSEIAPYVRGLV